ncbi:MAG: hypothetical protein NTY12_04295 [Candidatus Falkowbacteria bacterium]|nr:hypothetical protein [Candidatus Falkowbacteria bacterium]MCX6793219.1 hypothetical protein [Candidatus Falkowbacteria bacterium]MCX6793220.1 hypothetical protein [Candidatus Falkowbacteria bacterium]
MKTASNKLAVSFLPATRAKSVVEVLAFLLGDVVGLEHSVE